MARSDWLDENTNLPTLDERAMKLEHFVNSMADGIIDKKELDKQNEAVVTAMKAVQGELSDDQHAKVTTVLVEVTALTIMNTLHELAASRLRRIDGG